MAEIIEKTYVEYLPSGTKRETDTEKNIYNKYKHQDNTHRNSPQKRKEGKRQKQTKEKHKKKTQETTQQDKTQLETTNETTQFNKMKKQVVKKMKHGTSNYHTQKLNTSQKK